MLLLNFSGDPFILGGGATQFLRKSPPLCISAAHFGRKGVAEDDRTCQSTMCPGKSCSQAGTVSAVILASEPQDDAAEDP